VLKKTPPDNLIYLAASPISKTPMAFSKKAKVAKVTPKTEQSKSAMLTQVKTKEETKDFKLRSAYSIDVDTSVISQRSRSVGTRKNKPLFLVKKLTSAQQTGAVYN
jgi:hypothetical protein